MMMMNQLVFPYASKPVVFERYTGPPVVPTTRPTSNSAQAKLSIFYYELTNMKSSLRDRCR